jgi:low affinity Fe/Cu permease
MKELFRKIAAKISYATGTANAFLIALGIIVVWAITGPAFGYSDTWQLVINTGTTIVTFLMVFLIQNTQNRDSKAIHLKLDELIRSTKSARNAFIDLENFSDEDLDLLDRESHEMHEALQDNPTIRRLRKKIDEEKTRRLSVRGAGVAATEALKTVLDAPIKAIPKIEKKIKKLD